MGTQRKYLRPGKSFRLCDLSARHALEIYRTATAATLSFSVASCADGMINFQAPARQIPTMAHC